MNTDPIRKVFAKGNCLHRVTDDHQKMFSSSEYQKRVEFLRKQGRGMSIQKKVHLPTDLELG